MPDRAEEVEHLAEADRHVEAAEKSVAELGDLLARQKARGVDTAQLSELLATSEETLKQFRSHRSLIERTIQDIDAGKL